MPNEVEFATKPQLARKMLERAFSAQIPVSWVTADEVYGSDRRQALMAGTTETSLRAGSIYARTNLDCFQLHKVEALVAGLQKQRGN